MPKLCDKIPHCPDASDEPPTCVYHRPEQLGSYFILLGINKYLKNFIKQNVDIKRECLRDKNVGVHSVHNVGYRMISQKSACSPSSSSSDITFSCKLWQTPGLMHEHYFSLDRLCIFDHDCDDKYESHCLNGFHLLKCEHIYCVRRFKCPSSYCISFDHICNKVCDCPRCEDESICSKLLCPGMVLTEQVGSGLKCSQEVAALKHSMNMRQVIQRKGLSITDDFPVFIHLEEVVNLTDYINAPEIVVYCKIMHSEIGISDVRIMYHMISLQRLLLTHNSLGKVYDLMFVSMSQLVVLDLSHNFITYIPPDALCSLRNIEYISLHHNLIAYLQMSVLANTPNVQVLLLESNSMSPQAVIVDGTLPSLYHLSSDIPRLCCAFDTISACSPPFPLLMSCSNLITSKIQIALGWLVGLCTISLNLFCFTLLLYRRFISDSKSLEAVMLFSVHLTLAEIVISMCLLSYPIISEVYHGTFGVFADQWRHSWACLILESLFSVSSRATLAFAASLSGYFAIHIPSMTRRKSSHKVVIFQIFAIWLIISSVSISNQILEQMHNTDPFNYFCFPFTTLLPSHPLMLGLQIVLLILDCLLVMISIICYGYLLIFTIKRKRSAALQSVSKSKETLQKFGARLTVLILSSGLTWIPVLCVQILVLFQITVLPDIYLWCV